MSGSVRRGISAEHFLLIPEVPGKWFELVDGEMVETPTFGMRDAIIATSIWRRLDDHSEARNRGIAFLNGLGYVLRRDPDTVRIPDASFVRRERLPEAGLRDNFPDFPPDIAVELVTSDLSTADLRLKISDYLDAGVSLVWIVSPGDRSVSVYEGSMTPREYASDDTLDAGDVLPGFSVKVADLFDIDW